MKAYCKFCLDVVFASDCATLPDQKGLISLLRWSCQNITCSRTKMRQVSHKDWADPSDCYQSSNSSTPRTGVQLSGPQIDPSSDLVVWTQMRWYQSSLCQTSGIHWSRKISLYSLSTRSGMPAVCQVFGVTKSMVKAWGLDLRAFGRSVSSSDHED